MTELKGCQEITDVGQHLLDLVKTVDAGEMVEIVAKTPLGIEWRSSLHGDWFMQIPSMQSLILNWDERSSVYWFWDASFASGLQTKAHVIVPPALMKEIKSYLESIDETKPQ